MLETILRALWPDATGSVDRMTSTDETATTFTRFKEAYAVGGAGAYYNVLNTTGANGSFPSVQTQSRTDFGADGYGGPCPPTGDKPHRYQITVFAVDVDKLPDAKNDMASAALVGFDLHFHTLAKATLTGTYGR